MFSINCVIDCYGDKCRGYYLGEKNPKESDCRSGKAAVAGKTELAYMGSRILNYYPHNYGFEGKFDLCESFFLKMWGYQKAEEVLGRHASEFWLNPLELVRAADECLAKGEWTGEMVARRKDGKLFDASVSMNLIRDDEENFIGIMGSCVDITKRKKIEGELKIRSQELSEAKSRLDLALEATGMGTWDWDVDSNTMSWDENLFRLVGVTQKEFQQTYHSLMELSEKILPPDDSKRMMEKIQEVVEGNTDSYEIEHSVLRPDGKIRSFLVKGRAYRNSNGKLVRLIGTTMDITDRKISEETLRQSEANLARSQAIAHLGNYSWNILTGVVSWSEELKSIWGCRPDEEPSFEEVVSRIHPEDSGLFLEAVRLVREENIPFNIEYRIIRPDGSVRRVHDQGEITCDEIGNPVQMFGTTLDITQQKCMEEQLLNAKEVAEAASRAKSEFLANMSHEIRTPLNAILGMLELLLETDLSDEQQEYLQLAHISSESLLSVIDDILDFSRSEQNKMELEEIEFDLKSLIFNLISLLAGKTNSRGIKLTYHLQEDLPSTFIGDPVRLKQILFNLIGNALKFTKEGDVTLSIENYEAEKPASYGEIILLFKIQDTGIGIPQKSLDSIFNAFVQADASVTRKYGGTGLGLAISSQLVGLMGGRIWVESDIGKGSTFYFTVKVKRAAKAENRDEKREFPEVSEKVIELVEEKGRISFERKKACIFCDKGLNILLAEDHPINQKLFVRLLGNKGHQVTLVNNGEEVLDILSRKDFDVVIMDVQMPGMDGLEATRRIRDPASGVRWHEIPVIALTARAMKEDEEKCLEAGTNYYIPKPLRKEKLFRTLEDVNSKKIFWKSGSLDSGRESSYTEKVFTGTDESLISRENISADKEIIFSDISEDLIFDLERVFERTEGDEVLLMEMVNIFLSMVPQLLGSIGAAVEKEDAEGLREDIHILKSAAGSIGANRVFRTSCDLEQLGRENNMSLAPLKFKELKIRLKELEPVLVKYLENQTL
ncbi:MAG: PAS domain-containing protein [Methanosarcina sp.]